MKKGIVHPVFILFILLTVGHFSGYSQTLIAAQNINTTNANFRQNTPLVLGQVAMNIPSDGKVVVRFDGVCLADSGDRIVVAASNSTTWGINDGNVGIEVPNSAAGRRSFSHSRVYNVTAGSNTFYAVGQNYVNQAGRGGASVYGLLTAEFFPASGNIIVADTTIDFVGNVRYVSTPMNQLVITAPSSGTVLVHIDGQLYSSAHDDITLAASNTTYWGDNNGNVTVMAADSALNITPFSYTGSYYIAAGTDTFYADVQNYVDTQGTGNVSVYGTFTAEFFPDAGPVTAELSGINVTNINLRNAPVVLDTLDILPASSGVLLLRFDGDLNSSLGDLIYLAASDTNDIAWGSDPECESLSAWTYGNIDTTANSFSHSRVYNVGNVKQTYSAIIQNYMTTNGSGLGSVYAALTAIFYPGVTLGIPEVKTSENNYNLFPNPASNQLTVVRSFTGSNADILQISDVEGNIIRTINMGTEVQTTIDISLLAAGTYVVSLNGSTKLFTKQ